MFPPFLGCSGAENVEHTTNQISVSPPSPLQNDWRCGVVVITTAQLHRRRGAVVITTAQLHSSKPELRFSTGSNPARGVSEIRDGEDLWQWSRLEISLRLSSVNHTTKTFIIFIFIFINSSVHSSQAKRRYLNFMSPVKSPSPSPLKSYKSELIGWSQFKLKTLFNFGV